MSKEFFDGTGILTSSRSCYTSPEDCQIPTKLSELENDMNFIRDAQYQHTDNNFTDEYKEILDQNKDLPQAVEDAKNAADRANAAADISETLNENPPKIVNDYWWFYNIDTGRYENTGIKAIGDSFVIKRTYSSVQEMEDNFNSPDVLVGEFVVINTEDIEDPENSRLYMKAEESWKFITDLSGATGVTGLSAYQIAVQHGFEGTEEEWLESLSKDSKDAAKEAKAAASAAIQATSDLREFEGEARQSEELRKSQETIREQQEAAREQKTNQIISETTNVKNETDQVRQDTLAAKNETIAATEAAEEATSKTLQAISNAETATTAATEAAKEANKKATLAQTAADNANKAAETTNQAIEEAKAATAKATEAANNANEKATLANEKAGLADSAATKATEAATKADTATGNANQAATNANSKASLADEKATLAQSSAEAANQAAESANTAIEGANTAAGTANQAATSANQAAINATTQADRAKEFADNPPKIEGGTWWVWDENNDSYTNTGVSATGPKGDTGSGLNIIGELNSESELPAEGKSGDAYLINGQLYVYVGSGGNVSSNPKWSNVGTIKGDKGDAATIEVGNVTSGDVAKITNSGTSSAAIFDFVLPKGDAATIKVGTVTEGESAKITNSGNEHEAIFDFVLPSGEPGKSPKIQGGTWWVWSWEENDYVNTNISVSSDYELTKEKVENVLIGDITTHNHDSSYIKDAPKDSRYYGRQEGTWKILDDVFIKQESDPTVPEWAKQPNKPQYTAQEVGALPSDTEIPDISGLATKAELESKADVSSLNGKVDKIEGKGLSTEDFTTENKNDLNKLKSNLDWTTVE